MWKVFNGETLMASAALYWLAVQLILSLIDLVQRYCEQPQGHPKSRPTKPSSEAKRASCTRASAPRRLRAPAVWARSPSWGSWSGTDQTKPARSARWSSAPRKHVLQAAVREHVERGAEVHTDALKSYEGLAGEYTHNVIDHAESYARGKVHTNGLENFWSLLKRAIRGTYVSVEPFHLFRYLDEQVFRFNERRDPGGDAGRFVQMLRTIVGRRLTYKGLTGALATT